jgi:hypothetical protein
MVAGVFACLLYAGDLNAWVFGPPLKDERPMVAMVETAEAESYLAAVVSAAAGPTSLRQEALNNAVIHGDLAAVRRLTGSGRDVNEPIDGSGRTLLMVATWQGEVEIVKYLLERGADRARRDRFGHTAGDWARRAHSHEILELLGACDGAGSR